MPIPAGVTTATVHHDAPISFSGDPGRVMANFTPSATLVWEATGTPLAAFFDAISPESGEPLEVELPHTDQAGFVDGAGNDVTDWHYSVKLWFFKDGQKISFPPRDFQLTSGQTLVDLALIPYGEAMDPTVAPQSYVTSVNTLTGEVLLPLDSLTDVTAPSPTNGQVLVWDSATSRWVNGSASGSSSLDSLSDVTTPTPSNGQALIWDSATSQWKNTTLAAIPSALDTLTDVTAPSPTDGQVLTWDSGTSRWVNEAVPTPSVPALDALTDVTAPSPTDGQALVWDSGTSRWVNETLTTGGGPLDGLTDVTAPTPADGQVLTWDSGTSAWVNEAVPAPALDALSDVTAPSPSDGQALVWNTGTSRWVNGSTVASALDSLSDVTAPSPTDGQALVWDSGTSKWVNETVGAASVVALNVRDYGAVGDGTADDTTAIQAALDAVPDGGRAVYIPAGHYKVTATLQITKDGTTLFGDGSGNRGGATQTSNATRLEPTAAVTGSVLLVQRVADDRPLQGVTLRDFTIDGALLGTAVTGITFRCNQGHMDRVHVWKMSGTGLRVMGYASPAWDTYDSTFHNLLIAQNAGTGILLDEDAADTHWSHCISLSNQDNLIVKSSSAQFTGCHFYGPVRHDIWFDGGGSRTKFANCKIEGLKNHMVLIDSTNGGYSDIQFTGCGFAALTSDITDNTYDYVHITGPSANGITRTSFVGNSFSLKGGSTLKPRYAINLDGNAVQGSVIIANSFGPASHWGTAAVLDNGSSSTPATIKSNANVADAGGLVPFVNVADYGAKGNGTDDTVAIQAALDAVPATGGTVWFPPGIYKVSATIVIGSDNTTIRGSGPGARAGSYTGKGTAIQAAVGTEFTGPVVKIARPDATRAVHAPKLVDLAIDAQGVTAAGAGPVDALHITAIRGDFDNIALWSASGHNIRMVGLSSSFTSTGNTFRSILTSLAGGSGIHVDTDAPDNHFTNCVVDSNGRGIQTLSPRTHVLGTDFTANTLSHVYLIDAGASSRFTACKFRSAANHGVEITTTTTGISDVAFSACHFDGNGTAANNTYDHLNVGGSTSFAVSRLGVVACSFTSSATNKPRYGVNFATSAVQNAQLVGNTFGSSTHFGTSAYINSSNSTLKHQVKGNINVADVRNSSSQTANYTLVTADADTNVDMNLATAITLTVPLNSAAPMPIGTRVQITQIGAGQVTVAATGGVTLNTASTLTTRAQYSVINLRKRSTDTWVVSGDLTP